MRLSPSPKRERPLSPDPRPPPVRRGPRPKTSALPPVVPGIDAHGQAEENRHAAETGELSMPVKQERPKPRRKSEPKPPAFKRGETEGRHGTAGFALGEHQYSVDGSGVEVDGAVARGEVTSGVFTGQAEAGAVSGNADWNPMDGSFGAEGEAKAISGSAQVGERGKGWFGRADGDAMGVEGKAGFDHRGAAYGGGAYTAQGAVTAGNLGSGKHDTEARVGGGAGIGWGGRLHWDDADNDGRREWGFGADVGPVSFDIRTEAVHDVVMKLNPPLQSAMSATLPHLKTGATATASFGKSAGKTIAGGASKAGSAVSSGAKKAKKALSGW
jgi:hypothetical protein